jgi:hypothetical protein
LTPAHTARKVPEYLQQAARNLAFAQYIRANKIDHLDWAATALFYAAVHYVNAYFVCCSIPIPRRHTNKDSRQPGRTNIVQQDPTLKMIYPAYRHLDDESRDARYELRVISQVDYDAVLFPKLEKIKNFITTKVAI